MFMAETLTLFDQAMKSVFTASFPVERFRDLHVSVDYPAQEVDYPGIWVGFDISAPLTAAGIAHYELDETSHPLYRWRFQGHASYTIASLRSLERALLFDEVVKVLAFPDSAAAYGAFHGLIEDNPYIGVSLNADEVEVVGMAEMSGTPWGTDDTIYEVTVRVEVIGEFVSDPATAALAELSQVTFHHFADGIEADTTDPLQGAWQ